MKRLIGVLCVLSASTVLTAAEDDPIRAKLDAAKAESTASVEKLRTALRESLDKAEDVARAAGNKIAVDRVKAERKAFEDDGKVPVGTSGATYERGVQAARQKLEVAYKLAVSEYVKVKKDAQAEEVESELRAAKPRRH